MAAGMRIGAVLLSVLVGANAALAEDPPKAPAATPATPDRLELRVMVREHALRAGLPPQIADAVAEVESSYNPRASGSYGEVGLMQVLPSTARLLGFGGTLAELALPATNIHYGVAYLSEAWRLAKGDVCTTVMKYRAGHGETRFSYRSVDYCQRVRAILTAQGYPVTGEVPKPTFGEPVLAGHGGGRRAVARGRKSRVNWAAYDARMRALSSKVTASTLRIMQ
jgi:soluble lytic murein transglycosylase-like protein